jgi:hypothetical protein
LYNTLSSLVTHAAQTHTSASSAYSSLLQSDHLPAPEIYLPRLTQLLKSLNDSKEAALAVVKVRTDLVKALDQLLDRQKNELTKSEGLLSEIDEQVKGVKATRDEVQNMLEGNDDSGAHSTTPEVEPPVFEALTPPPTTNELIKSGQMDMGDELAGLENLDPEIVALLKKDMGLNKDTSSTDNGTAETSKGADEYAP